MDPSQIRASYQAAKASCKQNWGADAAGRAIFHLARQSLQFLNSECSAVDLISLVPDKKYYSYSWNDVVARPVNREFFIQEEDDLSRLWESWIRGDIDGADFSRLSYTVALTPCLTMELFDRGNKKGPATYFECYIGHMFAKTFGVNPTKRVSLPVHGRSVRMTMDFLFDLGARKVHVPVKMSTRERVVQAWAHQRLLDSAYGKGEYTGIMVLFSETKLDSRSHEVVEICVPDQWLAYQSLLSKMDRIYYFDLPKRYQDLTDSFPTVIQIKQFGEFFTEKDKVVRN